MKATAAGATSRTTLERMDEAWAAFRERLHALPAEQLERHIEEDGWTRKQMLAHIAAWHDLTSERLAQFVESSAPGSDPGDEDTVNARAARGAVGRTTGEIILAMDDSYRRLSREVARLTDAQMAAHDAWASAIVAGNTVDHYADHLDDLMPSRA